jgi:sulfur carrier protein
MTIRVNGESTELPDSQTIADLVRQLEMPKDGVAVAVNLEVVPRALHATTALKDGDQVELVRAVGGG